MFYLQADKLAVQAVYCKLDLEFDYRLAIQKDQLCFDHRHLPVFVLSVSILIGFNIIWNCFLYMLIKRLMTLKRHRLPKTLRQFGFFYSPFVDKWIMRMVFLSTMPKVITACRYLFETPLEQFLWVIWPQFLLIYLVARYKVPSALCPLPSALCFTACKALSNAPDPKC